MFFARLMQSVLVAAAGIGCGLRASAQSEEEKAPRRPHCNFPVIKRSYKQERDQLFPQADNDRTRGTVLN